MLYEAVAVRSARLELGRVPHADQIGRDAAAKLLQVRDDVAPEVGRGRVSVQEDDGVPPAHLDIGHLVVEHLRVFLGVASIGRDHPASSYSK